MNVKTSPCPHCFVHTPKTNQRCVHCGKRTDVEPEPVKRTLDARKEWPEFGSWRKQ